MLTSAFLGHYPAPWRIGNCEVLDRDGCNVQDFAADTPEDRSFWENVVKSVNAAASQTVDYVARDDVPDPVFEFLNEVADEIERATALHPGPNPNLAALTEEVGELAQALLTARAVVNDLARCHPAYWHDVRTEAVQVATMALRIVLEGDPTLEVVRP